MAINFLNHYITGDKLKSACGVSFDGAVRPHSLTKTIRSVDRIWCKTDYIIELFKILKGREKPCTIITHNSDIPIDTNIYEHKAPCVTRWVAQNVQISRPDLIPITIGIENLRSPGYSGDPRVIDVFKKKKMEREYLAFINFNIATNPYCRKPVWDNFKDKSWVVSREYGISFKACMNFVRRSKFVFSPPGHGFDTHRVAESVYLGAIPIVLNCHMYRQQSKTAPMYLVDDFEEVTKDKLEDFWHTVWDNKWTYNEWKIRYWQQLLKGIIDG